MPIELHERLSEFSYGYGVAREVEQGLRDRGLSAAPFFPNLVHEAELGFDVGFRRNGTAILLQFKLGQAMRRFVPVPRPKLQKTFWRYRIDTAESDGQFELLLKAELDGADVFYIAPKFHDWEAYLEAFESERVLRQSLIVRPNEIRRTLDRHRISDGDHKIVYDKRRAYLCSEPLEIETVSASDLTGKVIAHVEGLETPIEEILERIFAGFDDRSQIRRRSRPKAHETERTAYAISSDEGKQAELRRSRLNRLLADGRSRPEAVALAVGAEAWSMGAQVIFVTEPQ